MKKTLLLSLICISALADGSHNIETVGVTAKKEAVEKHLLTSAINHFEESEIQRTNGFLTELIQDRLPASQNGVFGQPTSFYQRGLDGSKTLFLLDGVRLNDISSVKATPLAEHIPLLDASSIDIIGGGQSGAYGSDAVAGVVSIETKKPSKSLEVEIASRIGSYNLFQNSILVGSRQERGYAKLFLAKTYQNPLSAYAKNSKTFDKSLERDSYKNGYISAIVGFLPTKESELELNFKKIIAKTEYDGGWPTDPNDPDSKNNSNIRLFKGSYKQSFKNTKFELGYSNAEFKRDQYGGYLAYQDELYLNTAHNYAQGSYLSIGAQSLTSEVQKSGGTQIDKSQKSNGVYASNTNTIGALLLTQTIRYDDHDSFDDKTTGKIGAKLSLGDGFLSANYALSHTTPTLYQRFGDGGVWVAPNIDLKPEDARGYDLGFEYGGFKIVYFYNKIKNLIDYVDSDGWGPKPGGYLNTNADVQTKGCEVELKKEFDPLSAKLFYTRLIAQDKESKDLPNRPSYTLQGELSTKIYGFLLGTNAKYIGNREDAITHAQTGNYTIVGANLQKEINKFLSANISVKNLFNRFNRSVDSYYGEPFGIYAQLKFSLR